MSGPPRLQVLAGGAFLSPAKVLRVMEPTQGEQLRILDRRWSNAGQRRRWFQSVEPSPPGSSEAAADAPGLRCGVWAAGSRQQPSPTRVRGGAVWSVRRVGPAGAPPRSSQRPRGSRNAYGPAG